MGSRPRCSGLLFDLICCEGDNFFGLSRLKLFHGISFIFHQLHMHVYWARFSDIASTVLCISISMWRCYEDYVLAAITIQSALESKCLWRKCVKIFRKQTIQHALDFRLHKTSSPAHYKALLNALICKQLNICVNNIYFCFSKKTG